MASRNEVFKLTIDVDAEIKNARAAAESLQKSFSKINLSDSIRNNLNKTFSNLEKELTNFETMTNKPFKNMGDVQKAEKSFENITNLFDQLKVTAKNVQGMDLEKIMPKDFVRQLDRVKDLYKTVTREAVEAGKEQQKAASNAKKAIADQNKELKELQKTQKELEGRQQQHQSDKELLSGNYKGRAAALKGNVTKAQNQVEATKEGTVARDIAENEAKNAQKIYNDYIKSIVEAQQREKEWANTHKETETKLKEVNSAIEQANNKIKEQEAIMNAAAESPASLEKLREALSAISGQDLSQIPTDLKDINEMVATLQADKMHEVAEQVGVLASKAEKAGVPLKVIKETIEDVHNSGEQLDETASEVERLGDRIRYFFSIGNTINLFKRAVRDAMNTIKELDATMTETATVTDFSISDMWQQLPHYTEEANKLGTSINSLYKATTLYYQQGLQTNEAMALGIETIKMARVANMDAAQATDLMTAALRGFNMELNETSAIRINDVYSELAAVTAADTDEIGIAISKTASIAHSANMEFETTAAFLSQIIETTREAPETAGTAMKTIVARFSEVKKLYSEGQITGTDEEGEVVNVNKIQEALRTVGIDMTKFFTGKEGLDQVLLRLAEKWDTLDVVTQRYIATQAAGSRQQSRFLAMMSDYDRTLQLVDAAYNSAGSGQAQFEKTLDSVQAKLSELKNAWDQFTMGIANDTLIKAGIDTLTKILSTINDIISAISGNNGLIKSIVSIGASFLALRGGAKLFNKEFAGKISAIFKGEKIEKEAKKSGIKIGEELGNSIGEGINKTTNKIKEFFSKENFGISRKLNLEKINYEKIDRDKFEDIIANNAAGLGGTLTTDQIQVARVEFETNGAEAGIKALQDFGAEIKVTKQGIQDWDKAATAVGQSLMGLGAVVSSIGGLISKDNEGVGEIVQNIGMVMTVIGGVIAIIPSLVAGINSVTAALSANPIGAFITAITVSITLLIGLISILSNFTPEKKLERAKKKAEESAKKAQEAQKAYDDLLSNRNNYTELEEKVASLTKGTQEWKDAVAELNSKVLELIENYEDLELEYDSEGNLKISKESWDKVEKESKRKVDKTTAKALSDQINVAKTQVKNVQNKTAAVDSTGRAYSEIELRTLKGTQSDEEWDKYLKTQEIKFVPTIDLSDAEKKLDVARKNLILAFMPDSIDKKEANQVGKALTALIGDAIDEETDPEQIQDVVNKYYEQYKSLTKQQKAVLSGQYDLIPGSTVDISNITDEDLKEKVNKQVEIYEAAIQRIPEELARIAEINKQDSRLDTFLGLDKNTALKLTEKTSEMGARAAQAYYKAWMAIDNKEVQKNLLNFEIGNINDLTSIIKLMRQAQIEEEKIQDYWKAAVKGAGGLEIKMGDIINRAEALSTELKSIEEFGKRAEEGSLTSEDIEKILGLGFDVSNLQKTAEGWRLIGVEIETVKRILAGELVEDEQITVDTLDQQIADTEKKLDELFTSGMSPRDYLNESTKLYDKLKELRKSRELAAINEAYAEASKYTADQNALQGGSAESVRYSAENEAEAAGLDRNELIAYSEKLQEIYGLEQATADRIALDNMKMNASIKELSDNWDKWGEALKDPSTGEYAVTLGKLQKNMRQLLGIDTDLSESFLTNADNMKLMEKAAEGDADAIDTLRKEAAKEIALGIDFDKDGIDQVESNLLTALEGFDPNIEIGTTLDEANLTQAFQELIDKGYASADEVNKALEGIGFEPDITTEEIPIDGSSAQRIVANGGFWKPTADMTGTEWVPIKNETELQGYVGQTATLPIINGKKTKYKGGSKSTVNGSNKKGGSGGKKGGGGGGSKKQNNWKNPYDKYYNLTEKINEALRTREKIERDYDRILNRRERTVAELLANSQAEVGNLQKEIQYQKQLQAGRREQIQNVAGERYDNGDTITTFEKMGVTKYANYNFDTQTIEIDWAAIEAVRDEELGKAIEAYVSRLEELQGQYEETQDTIEEMEDQVWEINQRGKSDYLELEAKTIQALINVQQKIIDDLSDKFESINNANDNILNSMQEQIDLERQIRDNTKTEEDIAKKEARLAYLRRDTSGANATEIMKLEQDLADARQNYTDTLIDQGMQKLSDENQKAAEQRQQQIDIMQAQLDWTAESGGFNQKAQELIKAAAKTGLTGSELEDLLKKDAGWAAMTTFAQTNWTEELTKSFKAAIEGMGNFKVEDLKTTATSSKNAEKMKDASGKNEASIWWDSSKGQWIDKDGNEYDVAYDAEKGYYYSNKRAPKKAEEPKTETPKTEAPKTDSTPKTDASKSDKDETPPTPPHYKYYLKSYGHEYKGSGFTSESKAANALKKELKKKMDQVYGSPTGASEYYGLKEFYDMTTKDLVKKKYIKKMKTGGLADFTGPAWLDGTKAHPELVLNARDTENFIQLKDILSGMGSLDKLQNGGDNYYNFDIKVDQLASDYDVDKLIGKIKNEIAKDAVYRNTNAIHLIR